MKLRKTINVINQAIELNMTQPILSIMLMLNEYKESPIVEIAGILNNCQNNVGVTIKKMQDNGLIELSSVNTKGANGHYLKQYTLSSLGKRTSSRLFKDSPKSIMDTLSYIVNATNHGIGLLDLRVMLHLAEANQGSAAEINSRFTGSVITLARRLNTMTCDGKLDRITVNNVNYYRLSSYGERVTLKILGIKTPATV